MLQSTALSLLSIREAMSAQLEPLTMSIVHGNSLGLICHVFAFIICNPELQNSKPTPPRSPFPASHRDQLRGVGHLSLHETQRFQQKKARKVCCSAAYTHFPIFCHKWGQSLWSKPCTMQATVAKAIEVSRASWSHMSSSHPANSVVWFWTSFLEGLPQALFFHSSHKSFVLYPEFLFCFSGWISSRGWLFKKFHWVWCWWLTPIILATQEAEIRRTAIWSQSQANSSWNLILKKKNHKKGLVEW
jgi:hypothetical protein